MTMRTIPYAASLLILARAAAPPRTRRAKTPKAQPLTPPRPPAEVEPCPHAPDCPSCTIDGGFDNVDTARRARAMFEPLLDKPFEIICGSAKDWRTQARLACAPGATKLTARGRRGRKTYRLRDVALGLYRPRSHDVVAIPDCRTHHPLLNKAAGEIKEACAVVGIKALDSEGDGDLRYVQLSTDGNKVALTLVWNERSAKEAQPEMPRLVKELSQSSLWHSIHVNYRGDKAGNAIFDYNPQKWAKLRGETYVIERLFDDDVVDLDAQLKLWFTPLTFRQANLRAFAGLVEKLAKWVPDDSHVCELYAGVGAIGLALRQKLASLRCSETNPSVLDCFEKSKRDQESRLEDLCPVEMTVADAEDAVHDDCAGADLLIVDPPHKGLCEGVREALVKGELDVKRLVYVSCGFDALERDQAALLNSRRWKLAHAEAHVFFPGSDHVETLAVYDAVAPE